MRKVPFLASSENCIVLAGGLGTRIRSITGGVTKHSLLIDGKVALQHVLQPILNTPSVKNIRIVVQPEYAEWMASFLEIAAAGRTVETYVQPKPNGTLAAVQAAMPFMDCDFFSVHYGDNLFSWNQLPRLDEFSSRGTSAEVYALSPKGFGLDFGFVDGELRNDGMKAVRLIEKPLSLGELQNPLLVTGFFRFHTRSFLEYSRDIPISRKGEFELTQVVQRMISSPEGVSICLPDCDWIDYGSPDGFHQASHILAQRKADLPLAQI